LSEVEKDGLILGKSEESHHGVSSGFTPLQPKTAPCKTALVRLSFSLVIRIAPS
jgi:hypothetical protein